jgi:predicted DNA-binding WGR domain protein
MQIVHEKNRDVYILFTRWGRIGEIGAYQRTPFPTIEEASGEFNKIFKSKSGNDWKDKESNHSKPLIFVDFEKKKKKYVIMQITENKCEYNELLKPIDHKKPKVPSELDKKIKVS